MPGTRGPHGGEVMPGPEDGADAPGLRISVDGSSEARAIVAVRGELDLAASPELEERIGQLVANGSVSELVLDLSGISFMDSTGLRALWCVRQRVQGTGGNLILAEPSRAVTKVLQMTKLNKVFFVLPLGLD